MKHAPQDWRGQHLIPIRKGPKPPAYTRDEQAHLERARRRKAILALLSKRECTVREIFQTIGGSTTDIRRLIGQLERSGNIEVKRTLITNGCPQVWGVCE